MVVPVEWETVISAEEGKALSYDSRGACGFYNSSLCVMPLCDGLSSQILGSSLGNLDIGNNIVTIVVQGLW